MDGGVTASLFFVRTRVAGQLRWRRKPLESSNMYIIVAGKLSAIPAREDC